MERNQFDELLENVKRVYGPFYSYTLNFEKTITPREDLGVFFNRLLYITNDMFRDIPIKKIRVLDLGSYEGIYSVGFAQLGAEVVSVEGRRINFAKMKVAKEYLGLRKLDVVQADVRTITRETYGRFDIVLACGIMYHLDAPSVFEVSKNISDMAERLAIIDTHISLSRPVSHIYKERAYWGMIHKEFDAGISTHEKELYLANALDNNESFWLTKISWLNLLKSLEFNTVYECLVPQAEREKRLYDRATLVAVKNLKSKSFFPVSISPDPLSEQIGETIFIMQDNQPIPNDNGIIVR